MGDMEGQLYYPVTTSGTTTTAFVNLTKDLSALNSKNFEHTTRDGHVKGFIVNLALVGASDQQFTFITAPNTWKMRNSFRKFHAYRDLMFANAGVTKEERGRYGHTIRPYLNEAHLDADSGLSSNKVLIPHSDNGAFVGGEWTHTQFASVPLYEQGVKMGESTLYVSDEWPVTILDDNAIEISEDKTSGNYKHVGMIHSYNLDRQEVVTSASSEERISGPENPLAALIASGNQAAGEILDITDDLEAEKPPYSIVDDGDSVAGIRAQVAKVPTTLGIVRTNMFVPAGIFELNVAGSGNFDLYVDVIGEVLCKDMEFL